jgi:hypothetical protein
LQNRTRDLEAAYNLKEQQLQALQSSSDLKLENSYQLYQQNLERKVAQERLLYQNQFNVEIKQRSDAMEADKARLLQTWNDEKN